MSFKHRPRKRRKPGAPAGPAAPQSAARKPAPARKHAAPEKPTSRSRWFYDVRQYALLTDAHGHVLILQLPAKYDEAAANAWTLPGGKLEPTDQPGEGLLREIAEETGLTATLLGPISVNRWTTRNSKKLAIFYRASVPGSKPTPKLSGEHQRAFWITKSELKDYPFHRDDMRTVLEEFLKN